MTTVVYTIEWVQAFDALFAYTLRSCLCELRTDQYVIVIVIVIVIVVSWCDPDMDMLLDELNRDVNPRLAKLNDALSTLVNNTVHCTIVYNSIEYY